jgi:YbbR domain-containing protein
MRVVYAVRHALVHNLGLKLLSLLAAFALWLFVNAGARDSEGTLHIPFVLRNLPSHLIIVSPQVDAIDVRVSGPRALLSRINPAELSIGLDLSGVRPGPIAFRVGTDQLNLPRGVRIVRLTPAEVTLKFARIGRRMLPVHLALAGKPDDGLRVSSTTLSPDSIEVMGPMDVIDAMKQVETLAVDLAEATPGLIERDVSLETPQEFVSYSAFLVRAQIQIEERQQTRVWKRVPVTVRNSTATVRLEPDEIAVTVRGPHSAVESLELSPGAVYIDAAGLKPGAQVVIPTVDLPAGVALVKQEPGSIVVQVPRERRRTHGR